jgi:arylsulfatase A-like enzyme
MAKLSTAGVGSSQQPSGLQSASVDTIVAAQSPDVPRRLATMKVAFCLPALLLLLSLTGLRATEKPNIVLMMSDDQGWGETSYNGHPHLKTPVLDAMAASGLRFDRFYAASPVCSPTRVSCMTGRHANRSGAFGAGNSTRPEEVTIAQILKHAGYATAHYGKWHIGAIKKGSPLSPNALGFDESWSHDNFYEMDSELSRNGNPPEAFKGESSEVIVDEALKFARKAVGAEKPFFIVLWFGSPHDPYSGSEEDIAPFEALGPEISRRFAEITAMDRAIGSFRAGLDEIGARENTLIWFNSDNGVTIEGIPKDQHEHLFNGNLKGHKSQLSDGGIRVPGIIEWPEVITKGRISSLPCVTSDILPTLIDIVNVQHPKPGRPLDGISLKELIFSGIIKTRPQPIAFWSYDRKRDRSNEPWIEDSNLTEMITFTTRQKTMIEAGKGRTWNFENYRHPEALDDPAVFATQAALIDNRFKLYLPRPDKNGGQDAELYDLQNDPGEATDLASKHPEIVTTMRAQLLDWQKGVEKSLTGADYRE